MMKKIVAALLIVLFSFTASSHAVKDVSGDHEPQVVLFTFYNKSSITVTVHGGRGAVHEVKPNGSITFNGFSFGPHKSLLVKDKSRIVAYLSDTGEPCVKKGKKGVYVEMYFHFKYVNYDRKTCLTDGPSNIYPIDATFTDVSLTVQGFDPTGR